MSAFIQQLPALIGVVIGAIGSYLVVVRGDQVRFRRERTVRDEARSGPVRVDDDAPGVGPGAAAAHDEAPHPSRREPTKRDLRARGRRSRAGRREQRDRPLPGRDVGRPLRPQGQRHRDRHRGDDEQREDDSPTTDGSGAHGSATVTDAPVGGGPPARMDDHVA